jgi:hypothetical protein
VDQVPYGREAELGVNSRVLDRLPSGPVALVLEGEAGIGKTALWQEVVSQAESRSYRVLSCQPTAPEADLSFASMTDLLDEVDEEALEGLPHPQRTALEVALLRREAEFQPEQRTVSSAFRGTLLGLSAIKPVVVAIDDAHWLGLPSARVLDFALRRLGSAPIGFVLAVRTEDVELPLPELGRALPPEQFYRLTLGPVPPEILRDIRESTCRPRSQTPLCFAFMKRAPGIRSLVLSSGASCFAVGANSSRVGSCRFLRRSGV